MEMKYTDIGVTILHLGPIGTSMWERLENEAGFEKVLKRGMRTGMISVAPVGLVAKKTLNAVKKDKREVRLPRRMAGGIALNGVGTRSFEMLSRGIDIRAEHGKPPARSSD